MMSINYTYISKKYDDYRYYKNSLVKEIVKFAEIKDGMKILDIGCGTGKLSFQLVELINVEIIGIDISFSMLKSAKVKSLEVICSDIDNNQLPFNSNSFDVVIGAYVIHQLNDVRFLFSECYRILRGGALILLTSSHKQIEFQHPVIKKFFPSYIDIDKNRFPNIPKIDYLLKLAGFVDIRHQEVLVADFAVDQEYLEKVRNKYVSTYHLLPQREYELGVERLEEYLRSSCMPELREWRGTLIYVRKNG